MIYAARSLRTSPGFSCLAVLTLAIGIGAVTTLFTIVDGVLLKPLRFPEPERVVAVVNQREGASTNLSGGDEVDIASEPDVFEASAYYHGGEMGVQLGGHAEFVGVRLVHPDWFRVFGVAPAAGRPFNQDDAERAAAVAASFAQRNFGGVAAALHRSLFIENRSYEIVAVMPWTMRFPENTEVWAAAALTPGNRDRTGHSYRAVARLAPGVSLGAANARLSALAGRLAAAYPVTNSGRTFVAVPLRDTLVSDVRPTLYILMAAVALVLLIACANAASLFLARAAARTTEIAVRIALGASRRHIVGQLLAESAMVAAAASAIGLVMAYGGTRVLLRVAAQESSLPRSTDIQVDSRVVLFGMGMCLLTSVAFGLVPAIQACRAAVGDAFKRAGSRGSTGERTVRVRGVLVVVQIALSFMLAINAGLLFRSLQSLEDTPLGFERDGVLVMYAHAPARGSTPNRSGLEDYLRVGRFFDDVLGRLRRLPEVASAGAVMGLPTGQYGSNGVYAVEGKHVLRGDVRNLPSAGFRLASPGYFATLHVPIVRGRDFSDADVYDRPFVAIVSESLARESFGNEDPIGRRIMCGLDQPDTWMTIVGVVGDVRQSSPASQPGPELYMPLRQHPYLGNEVQFAIRSRVPPLSLVRTVREIVQTADRDVAMKFTTLDDSVRNSFRASRFRAVLVATFAWLAVLLAIAGIYGLMSYLTIQRTAEFGIRAALGARPCDVARLVLASAGRLAVAGTAIGIVASLLAARAVTHLLFGITAADPLTFALAIIAAIPVVAGAAAIPAWRAARTDPIAALKAE